MSDSSTRVNFWRSVPVFTLGVVVGVFLLIALRVEYYRILGLQPGMAPQIAYLFSPIILGAVLFVAIPLEAVLRRISFTPQTSLQRFAVGIAHATSLAWWAFPEHWLVAVIVNQLVMRWLLGLTFGSRTDRSKLPVAEVKN